MKKECTEKGSKGCAICYAKNPECDGMVETQSEDRSTLKLNEPHPMGYEALEYIRAIPVTRLFTYRESMASCAIENNRTSEICLGTLNRVLEGRPISDRYIMGLMIFLMKLENKL